MRQITSQTEFQSNIPTESIPFTIESNKAVFSTLIKGVYDHPLEAFPRELMCNAADSHKAAGKENVPFEIELPSRLSPFLSIRDFGVGISHEELKELVSRIGLSSKRDDPLATGEKGLGFKSPLAYQNCFTISCFDGKELRNYTIGWEEDTPTARLMSREPSTEPRGVDVRVVINSVDVEDVRDYVLSVASHFGHPHSNGVVPPLIDGEPYDGKRSYENEKVLKLTDHVYIDLSPGSLRNRVKVYCGNYRYLCDFKKLVKHIPEENKENNYKYFPHGQIFDSNYYGQNVNFLFFIPMSSSEDGLPYIATTAGRDTLQYHERTEKWLLEHLREADKSVPSAINKFQMELAQDPKCNYFNQVYRLDKLVSLFHSQKEIITEINRKLVPSYPLLASRSLSILLCDKDNNLDPSLGTMHGGYSRVLSEEISWQHTYDSTPSIRSWTESAQWQVARAEGVLIVDNRHCWRRRAEQYGKGLSHLALVLPNKFEEAGLASIEKCLDLRDISYKRISSLPEYKPTKTSRFSESMKDNAKDQIYIFKSDYRITRSWDRLREDYFSAHADGSYDVVGKIKAHKLQSKRLGDQYFNFTGGLDRTRVLAQLLNSRAKLMSKGERKGHLLAVRHTTYTDPCPPGGVPWLDDFIDAELAFLEPLQFRVNLGIALRNIYKDANLLQFLRLCPGGLSKWRLSPGVRATLRLHFRLISLLDQPIANYSYDFYAWCKGAGDVDVNGYGDGGNIKRCRLNNATKPVFFEKLDTLFSLKQENRDFKASRTAKISDLTSGIFKQFPLIKYLHTPQHASDPLFSDWLHYLGQLFENGHKDYLTERFQYSLPRAKFRSGFKY